MADMPFPCNSVLLIQGNLPRVFPMFTLYNAIFLIPYFNLLFSFIGNGIALGFYILGMYFFCQIYFICGNVIKFFIKIKANTICQPSVPREPQWILELTSLTPQWDPRSTDWYQTPQLLLPCQPSIYSFIILPFPAIISLLVTRAKTSPGSRPKIASLY